MRFCLVSLSAEKIVLSQNVVNWIKLPESRSRRDRNRVGQVIIYKADLYALRIYRLIPNSGIARNVFVRTKKLKEERFSSKQSKNFSSVKSNLHFNWQFNSFDEMPIKKG